MSEASREDQFFEEHRDDLGRSLDYVPAEYWRQVVPVAPEVQAILDAWRAGGTDLPWSDAMPEGQERGEEDRGSPRSNAAATSGETTGCRSRSRHT